MDTVRRYEDFPLAKTISEIVTDVDTRGYSGGWSTREPAFLAIVRRKLAKFNVYLVDVKEGKWERQVSVGNT